MHEARVLALQHGEGEGAPGERLQVGVRQQPGDELLVQAEFGRIPVDPAEGRIDGTDRRDPRTSRT